MPVRKLSVALEEGVAISASHAAAAAGVSLSAWLSRAAKHELALERGRRAVREWEREHGALTDEELGEAGALLDRLLVAKSPKRRAAKGATRRA